MATIKDFIARAVGYFSKSDTNTTATSESGTVKLMNRSATAGNMASIAAYESNAKLVGSLSWKMGHNANNTNAFASFGISTKKNNTSEPTEQFTMSANGNITMMGGDLSVNSSQAQTVDSKTQLRFNAGTSQAQSANIVLTANPNEQATGTVAGDFVLGISNGKSVRIVEGVNLLHSFNATGVSVAGILQAVSSATMCKIYQTTAPNKVEIQARNNTDSGYQIMRLNASVIQLAISNSVIATINSTGLSVNSVFVNTKTPASSTDTGTAGQICWDSDYVYVCVASNTWKRTSLSTW